MSSYWSECTLVVGEMTHYQWTVTEIIVQVQIIINIINISIKIKIQVFI